MSTDVSKGWFGRLFTLRNAVKVLLWTTTLIILFYAEENWRGARMWAATKAEWEAKGESFDYAKLIPPPVPDHENLAVLPIFALAPDPGNPIYWTSRLQQAVHARPYQSYKKNWQGGQLTGIKDLQAMVATLYRNAFPHVELPESSLEQFDQLYPDMVELRSSASSRPYCRLPQEYPPQSPFTRLLALSTGQIAMASLLTLHGDLALTENKPDLALGDIRTNFKIVDGMAREPFLVSGFVAIAMSAINLNTVYNGLAQRVWNDQQLAELEQILSRIDFLTDYQKVMRGEALTALSIQDEARAGHPMQITDKNGSITGASLYPVFWPAGWIDARKADIASQDLGALRFIDLPRRTVDPHWADQLEQTPGPLLAAAAKFSRMQVWVDEARIACALERYRMVHGVYPGALADLETAGWGPLPHDIMNGDAYRYQLKPDGSFQLDSVGWNQKDDGGVVIYKKDSPRTEEPTQGDWVWPTPKPGAP